MSYTPTTWSSGDTITAAKLNKLEQGVANAGSGGGGSEALIVTVSGTGNTRTMSATFGEIYNALKAGTPVYLQLGINEEGSIDSSYNCNQNLVPIVEAYKYDTMYRVYTCEVTPAYFQALSDTLGSPMVRVFQASSSSDYPTFLRRVYVSSNYLANSNSWL